MCVMGPIGSHDTPPIASVIFHQWGPPSKPNHPLNLFVYYLEGLRHFRLSKNRKCKFPDLDRTRRGRSRDQWGPRGPREEEEFTRTKGLCRRKTERGGSFGKGKTSRGRTRSVSLPEEGSRDLGETLVSCRVRDDRRSLRCGA